MSHFRLLRGMPSQASIYPFVQRGCRRAPNAAIKRPLCITRSQIRQYSSGRAGSYRQANKYVLLQMFVFLQFCSSAKGTITNPIFAVFLRMNNTYRYIGIFKIVFLKQT